MRNTIKSILLAVVLAQASIAMAQETTTPQPAEDLNLGEPAGPRIGERYAVTTIGAWEIRCVRTPEGQEDPCNMYQLLLDGAGNQVAEVSLFRLPDGSRAVAGANIIVPLETLLPQQLTLSVDGNEARTYPFTYCNAGGCVTRVGFTDPEIAQFKAGSKAVVRLVPAAAPTEEVLLDMSLAGFTASYDSIPPVQ